MGKKLSGYFSRSENNFFYIAASWKLDKVVQDASAWSSRPSRCAVLFRTTKPRLAVKMLKYLLGQQSGERCLNEQDSRWVPFCFLKRVFTCAHFTDIGVSSDKEAVAALVESIGDEEREDYPYCYVYALLWDFRVLDMPVQRLTVR